MKPQTSVLNIPVSVDSEMYIIYARSSKRSQLFHLVVGVYFVWLIQGHFGSLVCAGSAAFFAAILAHGYYFSHAGWSLHLKRDLHEQECRRNLFQLEINSVFSALAVGSLALLYPYLQIFHSWTSVMALLAMHIALLSTTMPLVGRAFQINVALIGVQILIGCALYGVGLDEVAFSLIVILFFSVLICHGISLQKRTRRFIHERNDIQRIHQENEHSRLSAIKALEHKMHMIESMNHDIRNPLHIITTSLNVFEQEAKETANKDELDAARLSLKSIQHMLDAFLEARKISEGKVVLKASPLSLIAFIQEQIEIFKLRARQKNIELVFDFDSEVNPYVYVDCTLLSQVVGNLLSNAVKYTARGRVVISLQMERATRFSDNIVDIYLSVRDSGSGISEDIIRSLTERFKNPLTVPTFEPSGHGLGLSIVYKVLHEYFQDGDIQIVGTPGVGTLVEVEFLLPRCDMPRGNVEYFKPVDAVRYSGTVLLVDDTEFILANTEKLIRRFIGMDSVLASSGEVAVALSEGRRFDLILMDCHMDGMTGFEATAVLREIEKRFGYAKQPIIMVSADGTDECKELAASVGADDYLLKPFDPMDLKIMLKKHLSCDLLVNSTIATDIELEI